MGEGQAVSEAAEVKVDDASVATLRAYLQRAEVRLSTMHRIAGAFLGGAGLLILLPAFLRDAISTIFEVLSTEMPAVIHEAPGQSKAVWLLFAFPFSLAFFIPVYALWLLLKDLTVFYFSANIPQDVDPSACRDAVFHPRFALTAIPFSNDDSPAIKKQLRSLQFGTALRHFVLPHSAAEKQWLTKLVSTPEGKAVALPRDKWLEGCPDNEDTKALRLAFGLAGAYNRTLVEEVAKTELSLIRHNLYLRRLVMRYMKALLALVWTALLSFVVLAWVHASVGRDQLTAVAVGFLVWSSLAPLIVRAPVRWVYREYDQNTRDSTRDPHIVSFERWVVGGCVFAATLGMAGAGMLVGWTFVWVGPVIALAVLARSFGKLDVAPLRWL